MAAIIADNVQLEIVDGVTLTNNSSIIGYGNIGGNGKFINNNTIISNHLKNSIIKTNIVFDNDFTFDEKNIPDELEEYTSILYFLPPTLNNIKTEIARILKIYGQEIELEIFNQISAAFLGFSINQIRQIISKLIIVEKKLLIYSSVANRRPGSFIIFWKLVLWF